MASSGEPEQNKMVTGYPAFTSHVATGYPAAATTTTSNAYAFRTRVPISSVYGPLEPTSYSHPVTSTLRHRVFFFFIITLLIMAFLFLTTYLVFKPRLPVFRVDSATVSQLNLTQSEITATWLFTLFVNNLNQKVGIHYDRLQASVFYGDELGIAMTQLAPFFQNGNNATTIKFQLNVVREYVGEDVVQEISNEMNRGSVDFVLRIFAWVRFRSGFWRMREHMLRVDCNPVRIGFLGINGTGNFMGQSKNCEVYLWVINYTNTKWIIIF